MRRFKKERMQETGDRRKNVDQPATINQQPSTLQVIIGSLNMHHKILLVDDDIDLVITNTAVLESAGYEVHSANDGKTGFELFKQCKPELAIVDLNMEHFDSGFVLCHRIKSLSEGADVPVIILTSAGHETGYRFSTQTNEEKQWIKADYYLEKPIAPADLLQFLQEKFFKNN
jgi:DNA-binding response OmpR family regulator